MAKIKYESRGVKFDPKKMHEETCTFQEWKRKGLIDNDGSLIEVSGLGNRKKTAIGSFKKDFLCEDHFHYACALNKVSWLTEDER